MIGFDRCNKQQTQMVSSLLGLSLLLLAPLSFASDGWFEVTRGMTTLPGTTEHKEGRLGDLPWVVQVGDNLSTITQKATGSTNHLLTVARYNGINLRDVLVPGTVLMIPQAFVKNGQVGISTRQAARSEIREFQAIAEAEVSSLRATNQKSPDASQSLLDQKRSPIPNLIETVNVDMFAGEVKVMGRVAVSRVAVGNGDIIRAEVLNSGELLVIAQTAGSTSLRLWHNDGRQSDFNIRVSATDPETRVRMETMVRMRVRMIEFRKSALGKLGIDWSDSVVGPGLAVAGDALSNNLYRPAAEGFTSSLPNSVKPFQTYFGIASNITSRINLLASTGDARTLAEPVLSTTNGGSASFLAGGEVPYPSIGSNGQTVVQFKEYGIKLNVSPNIDSLGNVRTIVETEISQLDPAVSVQGAPGLLTRRAQTQVNVRSGETIVISGLLSNESSKDIDKIPGIGNLPVIGSFFRANNARNTVNELVIFVTPGNHRTRW